MNVRPRLVLALLVLSGSLSAQKALLLEVPTAEAIADQADAGAKLRASSVPKLGRLYPLSEELFVSPDGAVGVGTTTPMALLDVQGSFASGRQHEGIGIDAGLVGGLSNNASGTGSVVLGGALNSAEGTFSVVLGGQQNTSSGAYAVTSGILCDAAASYTFAAGRYARALHQSTFVWNGSSTFPWESTDQAQFLINAPNGVGIGTNAPNVRLHVAGGSDASPTGGGYVQTGNTFGANLVFDENEIMARSNGAVSNLFLNHEGGNVLIGAASTYRVGIGTTSPADRLHVEGNVRCTNLIETSDARLKEGIEDLEGSLEAVLALRGVRYRWKDAELAEMDPGERLGFLAQEVRQVLPEAVSETEDGTLGIDYSAIVPVLVEALQSQEVRLQALEAAVLGDR